MATINIHIPDALRRRMEGVGDVDWSTIAERAFESHLLRLAGWAKAAGRMEAAFDSLKDSKSRDDEAQRDEGYDHGYAWARERAEFRDLQTVVEAPDYRSAADVVRRTPGFSQRDEFGDASLPSDEMWEGFVDGVTAVYNDVVDRM